MFTKELLFRNYSAWIKQHQ